MPTKQQKDPASPIGIISLMRLGDYVQKCRTSEYPVSFRDFVGEGHSHRALVETIDAVERRSKKLVMLRAIYAPGRGGKKTGEVVDNIEDIDDRKSRRLSGAVTPYGQAWGVLGLYIKELIQHVLAGGGNMEDDVELREFLEQQRKLLHSRRRN